MAIWLVRLSVKLSSRKLDTLIAYQPEDLTVTVGAGMEFEHLQEILADITSGCR